MAIGNLNREKSSKGIHIGYRSSRNGRGKDELVLPSNTTSSHLQKVNRVLEGDSKTTRKRGKSIREKPYSRERNAVI